MGLVTDGLRDRCDSVIDATVRHHVPASRPVSRLARLTGAITGPRHAVTSDQATRDAELRLAERRLSEALTDTLALGLQHAEDRRDDRRELGDILLAERLVGAVGREARRAELAVRQLAELMLVMMLAAVEHLRLQDAEQMADRLAAQLIGVLF